MHYVCQRRCKMAHWGYEKKIKISKKEEKIRQRIDEEIFLRRMEAKKK